MIKVTILEDDSASADFIETLLAQNGLKDVVKRTKTDELDLANPSDIYLIDVELSEGNGVDAAVRIRDELGDKPVIVFITAHDKYVYDAFDTGAFNYILKPIDTDRFDKVIKAAVSKAQAAEGAKLVLKCKGAVHSVDYKNILYVESFNHKVAVRTKEGTLSCYARLSDLEARLGEDFFRVHRGYLVNLAEVAGYNSNELWLTDGSKIYISKHKRKDFKAAHLNYLRRLI